MLNEESRKKEKNMMPPLVMHMWLYTMVRIRTIDVATPDFSKTNRKPGEIKVKIETMNNLNLLWQAEHY
jgi:hypothetical protein